MPCLPLTLKRFVFVFTVLGMKPRFKCTLDKRSLLNYIPSSQCSVYDSPVTHLHPQWPHS